MALGFYHRGTEAQRGVAYLGVLEAIRLSVSWEVSDQLKRKDAKIIAKDIA